MPLRIPMLQSTVRFTYLAALDVLHNLPPKGGGKKVQ